MTAPPPRRPWWRRKRWWAACAVWLLVAYPLSVGLLAYADGRGWVDRVTVVEPYCLPLLPVARALPGDPVRSCLEWCAHLGQRHAASD